MLEKATAPPSDREIRVVLRRIAEKEVVRRRVLDALNDLVTRAEQEHATAASIEMGPEDYGILRKYCRYWRWVERFHMLSVPRPAIAGLMACCPKDGISDCARAFGSTGMNDVFRTIGLFPSHDKVVDFIQNEIADFGNWFTVTVNTRGRKDFLHLRHALGRNWSVFISESISATFEQILNEKVSSEISDNFVTLCVTP